MSYNVPPTVINTVITKNFGDFAIAGLTSSSPVLSLTNFTQIIACSMYVVTPADLIGTMTLSLGWFSTTDTLIASDAKASAGAAFTNANFLQMVPSTRTITAYAVAGLSNLNTNTQGQWEFRISYIPYNV